MVDADSTPRLECGMEKRSRGMWARECSMDMNTPRDRRDDYLGEVGDGAGNGWGRRE
jgi:hypothetical protein